MESEPHQLWNYPSNGRISFPSWLLPSPGATSGAYDSSALTRRLSRHVSARRPSIPPSYPSFAGYSCMLHSIHDYAPTFQHLPGQERMTLQTYCPAGSFRGSFLLPRSLLESPGPSLGSSLHSSSPCSTMPQGPGGYLPFIAHTGVQPPPARKPMVVYFIAELSRSLAPSTVAVMSQQ